MSHVETINEIRTELLELADNGSALVPINIRDLFKNRAAAFKNRLEAINCITIELNNDENDFI